jgi:hypothetical protein
MIDEPTATEQLNRLSEYDGFHALTREAMQDMLYAVQTADTPEIARLVMDEIKAEHSSLPLSAHIRRRMNEENDRDKPDPVLEEHEHWKAEAQADPEPFERMQASSGIWKKGRFPLLDRHLELLGMYHKLRNRMPPELLAEYRALTERLREAGDPPERKHLRPALVQAQAVKRLREAG